MSLLKTYIAHDQETVYDLAIKLYQDARGVSDLLILNPGLDLDAETIFGQSITWDPSVKYKREVFVIPIPEPQRPKWKTRTEQNVYDLAIQVYGEITNLGKIISQVEDMADPLPGTEFETEFTDNLLANVLFSRKIVATSGLLAAVTNAGGIGIMIIETSFIID